MKFNNIVFKLGFALLALLAAVGCSDDHDIDSREQGYGYVQFKLLKKGTRSELQELEYLSDAKKITVTLRHNMESFNQMLPVEERGHEEAEFGLNTTAVKMQSGDYELIGYSVYNALDERILSGTPDEATTLTVVDSQLTLHEIYLSVKPRGKMKFSLSKDLSELEGLTRADKTFTFDEIKFIDLELTDTRSGEQVAPSELPCTFVLDDQGSSRIKCDTIIEAAAGDYRLDSYTLYDEARQVLTMEQTGDKELLYKVEDNAVTEVDVKVTIKAAADYIKDYIVLKKIWEALDGPNWYWIGDGMPRGANWNFDKDVDLWGDQPGVLLHPNGRVASLNIGGFDPKGDVPECLGDLSELTQLWIGHHSDTPREEASIVSAGMEAQTPAAGNRFSTWARALKGEKPADYRFEMAQEELRARHPVRLAEVALNMSSKAEALVASHHKSGYKIQRDNNVATYDMMELGKIANHVTSLPRSIYRLKKLEALYVGNGLIREIPDMIRFCESLTDLEVYNCTAMTKFPDAIGNCPQLTLVNFSGNSSIPAEEMTRGLKAMFDGKAREKIQILYLTDNNIVELPENANNLKMLGLLDLANNKLEKIHHMPDVALVQLYLDNNRLEELPSSDMKFFKMDDCENFSVTGNRLKTLPNIFTTDTKYFIGTVDFTDNQIESIEGYDIRSMELVPDKSGKVFQGIKATTLKVEGNKLRGAFPAAFGLSNSEVTNYDFTNNLLDSLGRKGLTAPSMKYTVSLALGSNEISEVPDTAPDFDLGVAMPYLEGIDLSANHFVDFPKSLFTPQGLSKFYFTSQFAVLNGVSYRSFKVWPDGIEKLKALRDLRLDGNDLRFVKEFPTMVTKLSISDNPNISMVIPDEICAKIVAGTFQLAYDVEQSGITGCPQLGIQQ